MSGSSKGRSSGGAKGGGGAKRDGKGRGGSGGRQRTPKGGQGRGKGGQGRGKGGGRGPQGDDTVAKLSGPLERVLTRLPETQRRVLELRMGLADGHPHDLADTARALGLSQSETRDIERRAFEHIREVVPLDKLHKLLGD